jgi:hydrophobic/amphiphilic exporter-1 (mainly G- bacteria), HAE1 family
MTRFFVRHPVTTWMIFGAFVVLALYALPKMEVEAIPEVELPSLTVVTRWNGASPKAIQRSITIPVEEAVRALRGSEKIESTSRAGVSTVEVEFNRDTDIDFARLELNEQLGSVRRNLPLNASQPVIQSFVPEEFGEQQFFTFSVESDLSPNELREDVEQWVLPQVLGVEGVADAQVVGGALPLVKVKLDRELLRSYDINADEVFARLSTIDDLGAAGVIRESGVEKLVALRPRVTLRDLAQTVVARRGGQNFTLDMLGEVDPDYQDPTNFVRSNGRNVVQVQVEKRSGGNAVVVSQNLRTELPKIEADLPFEARLTVDADQGEELEEKLQELLWRSLIILAVLFLLLAASLRQVGLTAIVIGSVIFALVICLSLFYFLGLSVNFITISGLTICFGMLLDNSILVLDSIHRRLTSLDRAEAAGLSRKSKVRVVVETVVQGTGEVTFPILATTLTTIVAFLSFIFLSGRLALYYVPLAISVGTAMMASIFVAFGWIPVVLEQTWAKRLVSRSADGPNEIESPDQLEEIVHTLPDLTRPLGRRERVMAWTQRLWPIPVIGLVALCWFGWNTYDEKVIKGGFFRLPDQEKLICYLRMPDGTDVRVTSETFFKFESSLMPLEDGATMRANVFGNQAYMEIEFEDRLLATGIPMLYRNLLTEQGDVTGGSSVYIAGFSDQPYIKGNFGGSNDNSLIKITGYNSKILTNIAEDTLRKAERARRARNPRITSTARFGRATNEETVVTLRRDVLANTGLSVVDVVGHLRRLLGVDTPWRMIVDGEQEQMQLAYSDADEIEFADVAGTMIETSTGKQVQLASLVTMETVPLSNSITRENQRYSMFVNWEYVGTDKMRRAYIQSILDSMDLPYGYAAEEARREFFTEEEEQDLKLTMILAVVFIFMVLAALFESISLPLLVLTSVPMALVGVVLAYWKSGSTFDSSAQIGLVLLFGIVVNNAILLVSRFRHEAALILKSRFGGDPEAESGILVGLSRRLGGSDLWHLPPAERGVMLRRAVVRGTFIRMRSVLLTSGTTVVGLLPLLISFRWVSSTLLGIDLPFELSWLDTENQDIWVNLALSSIGGLVSSTVLLLVVLPSLYYGCVQVGWVLRRLWNGVLRLVGWGGESRETRLPGSHEQVAG